MVDGAIRASILQQVGIFDLLGVIGALLHMANYTRLVMRPALIMVSALGDAVVTIGMKLATTSLAAVALIVIVPAQRRARSRPSQAAPRTPELSPKAGGRSRVATRSEKT
jgi:hypothetical protein